VKFYISHTHGSYELAMNLSDDDGTGLALNLQAKID